MLKLTNSFYRYLRLTSDYISSRLHVREITYLSSNRKICKKDILKFSITDQFKKSGQVRLFSNYKVQNRQKKPVSQTNVSKKNKPMSGSWQPDVNHTSFGGKFEITDDVQVDWENEYASSGSENNINQAGPPRIPPDFRVWEPTGKMNDSCSNPFRFRVLSYNVLAQYLLECHPYLYTECYPRDLKWNVRAARLYNEIRKLAPDILCFQEVQATHLGSFYSKFEELGYSGIFKRKTGRRHDGCAIYFKQSLFEMQDNVSVEFYQPELPILNRDNIGMMVKLVPRSCPNSPFVVATTHLLYNPKRTDVRLAQLQVLLAEIDRFAYYDNGRESGHLPVILTGDFNSTPESAVVKLLDNGCVSASPFRDSSDWKKIGVTDNCQHLSVYLNRSKGIATDFNMTKIYNSDYCDNAPDSEQSTSEFENEHSNLFNSGAIGHSFKLSSVYSKTKQDGSTEATTFQEDWVTVDYIYFSCCSSLKLTERLRLPTAKECNVLGKLPNEVYGSDHLALGATFELKSMKSSL